MSAGGGDLERPLGAFLAFDVGEVWEGAIFAVEARLGPRQRLQPLEVIDEREEVRRRQDIDVLTGPCRFGTAGRRTDQPPCPMALAPMAAGKAPGMARIEPSSANSPIAA